MNNFVKFINNYFQIYTSTNPLNKLSLFLIGILNVDEDGLLIYDTKLNCLKFILINPVRDFNYLLRETKCMIFIGGTMKPCDDFYNVRIHPLWAVVCPPKTCRPLKHSKTGAARQWRFFE